MLSSRTAEVFSGEAFCAKRAKTVSIPEAMESAKVEHYFNDQQLNRLRAPLWLVGEVWPSLGVGGLLKPCRH